MGKDINKRSEIMTDSFKWKVYALIYTKYVQIFWVSLLLPYYAIEPIELNILPISFAIRGWKLLIF